ncbi:MAG: hypothetical protein ACRYF4_08970, partial [Janthinobacterium lividum]
MTLLRTRWLTCCTVLACAAAVGLGKASAQASPIPTGEPEVLRTSAGLTEVGVLGRAEYRIDVPENWNRGLVVFYHGYSESAFR